MKKIFLGMIIGFIISFATSTYASFIIGKVVDGTFPLKINGKQAGKDVIVIEGTSYLPVRVAGELFGYRVDWVNNEVVLYNNTTNDPEADRISSIIENAKEYQVVSNVPGFEKIDTRDPYKLFEIDGQIYINPRLFGGYAYWENPYMIFKFPNQEPIKIKVNDRYSKNVDAFTADGRAYIKPSAIGFKATLQDNKIVIEKL